ncbi:MAG: zinc ribbon domain-containing protein [Pseudomonadota bacterium]|nr:zinc ribbon domain-containing protein [Pseudomonadota bacterium]
MPTYDYRCPNCQAQFQARHAVTAEGPTCPACGAEPERIILSAPAVQGRMAQGREAAMRTFEKQQAPTSMPS